jgi:hypothetical protein
MVESLPKVWDAFKSAMEKAKATVGESRVAFKASLLREAEDLTSRVTNFRDGFLNKGPFSAEATSTDAIAALSEARETIASIRESEGVLRSSLEVFDITQEAYREITDTESDLGCVGMWRVAHVLSGSVGARTNKVAHFLIIGSMRF